MALARAKVMCSDRQEHVQYWAVDKVTGEPSTNSSNGVESRSGPVTPAGKCYRQFTFVGSYPQTGIEENEKFWDATPSFEMKMGVQNANVDFEVGKHYYLDFVRTLGEAAL
jgi:hypothetical protein